MSPSNRKNVGRVSVHAGSSSARRSNAESASGTKKSFVNRNVKRKVHSGVKPRGEKSRPLKSPASATPAPTTRIAKKEINKASPLSRRPTPALAASGKKSAKAAPTKKSPLKKAAVNDKEHGGLFINEMSLSAGSPVTPSMTTASSLRLSPSAFMSSTCGRSPRTSAGGGGSFSPNAYNASLTQCTPKSEGTRRQSDLGTTRNTRKSGGFFSWLWKMWS